MTNPFILWFTSPLVHHIPQAMTFLLLMFFLGLQLDFFEKKLPKITKNKIYFWIKASTIIFFGLYFRLSFAYVFKGGFDLHYWWEAANIAIKGKNIYSSSPLYNYFPPWIIILTLLKKINLTLPSLHFYFVVRLFLTLIDVFTLYLLIQLAKLLNKPINKVMIGFFLNPLIIIITGFHGQFENVAMVFIILGYLLYKKTKNIWLSWFSFSFGGFVKHMLINQVLIFLNFIYKDKKKVICLFGLTGLLGFLLLLPYFPHALSSIINNLFLYSYIQPNYGFPNLLKYLNLNFLIKPYLYLFIITFFILPFLLKGRSLLKRMLLGTLFFIAFTPGIGDQYFILPIALAVLDQNYWFVLYSIFTSLYLFGSSAQFNINFFKIFTNNYIWLISLFWFVHEIRKKNEKQD